MHRAVPILLHWLPRLLALLHSVFIGLFAFDVFDLDIGLWQSLLAFAIHLIPSLAILAVLIVSWRRPLVGAAGFLLLGVLFFWRLYDPRDGIAFLYLLVPSVACALLYLCEWFSIRNRSKS